MEDIKLPCFNCKKFRDSIYYATDFEEHLNDPRLGKFGNQVNQVCGPCISRTIDKAYCEKCYYYHEKVT